MSVKGRPLKYVTPDEMQVDIDKYFEECYQDVPVYDKNGDYVTLEKRLVRPYTVSGLANSIGLTRQSLINYAERDEFFDTISRAKEKCQQFAEEQLFLAKSSNGATFSLKNNWGWKDKTETEITGANGGPVDFALLPADQRQSRIKELMEKYNG